MHDMARLAVDRPKNKIRASDSDYCKPGCIVVLLRAVGRCCHVRPASSEPAGKILAAGLHVSPWVAVLIKACVAVQI